MSILQLHGISSLSLDVSTFSWLQPSRAATYNKTQEMSNRASQTDFVAAYGHPTEIALFERLRIIATDILTRQFFQEEKRIRDYLSWRVALQADCDGKLSIILAIL